MKLLTQSLVIFCAMLSILVITQTALSAYQVPILGVVILFSVIFIIIRQRRQKKLPLELREELFTGSNKEVFTVTLALLLAIFLTGGLNSNLYFLLYFLIFGVVFLFEPLMVFALLLGLMIVFFPSLSEGDLVSNLVKLGSLVFLSPIAYFFGLEFQRRKDLSREIKDKTGQIIEDANVLKSRTIDENALDELDDIEQNAKELKNKAMD